MPSHSRMVVAVPTKKRLAFSLPGFVGCTCVVLAVGRWEGWVCPFGWSRVGAVVLKGSRRRDGLVLVMVLMGLRSFC